MFKIIDGEHCVALDLDEGVTVEEVLPMAAYALYSVKVPPPEVAPELLKAGCPIEKHRQFVAEREKWNEGLKATKSSWWSGTHEAEPA